MKLERMLGILTCLLQKDRITAVELAEKFEVSVRTILRDVDAISQAGIPLITHQGNHGGISIAKGYKLKDQVLTDSDRQSILSGLKGMGSISDDWKMKQLIERLSVGEGTAENPEPILRIDLASHYKESLSEKIEMFKKAIKNGMLVYFDYYSEKGMSTRKIEPYEVNYSWGSWYVLGFCTEKMDFRLFKLNRLWNHQLTEESFEKRMVPEEVGVRSYFKDEKKVKIRMKPNVEYLLVEDYGPNSYIKNIDGTLDVTIGYTNKEFILRWILGFGENAEVIEPETLRRELRGIGKVLFDQYKDV